MKPPVSRFPFPVSRVVLAIAFLTLGAPAQAQNPQQLEFLRQNPELVRQQLLRSGLTMDQMRARLQSAGLSPNVLDRFIQPGADTSGVLAPETLRALQVLGVARVEAEGLVITGDVEFAHELSVTREGFIIIPQVGQLFVSNLTMEQLNALLRQRLGRSYSGIPTGTTRFDVTIARLRTNQVFVIGEVMQPGAYQLASVATTLNALYAAGGLSERGNFREIQIRRNGEVVSNLDLYDYLLRGDAKNDIVLEQGDVVFVPVRGVRASITGAVIRPAIYELKTGQSLANLIEAAGGFAPAADLKRVAVHRIVAAVERAPGPVPRAVVDVGLTMDGAGAPQSGSRAMFRGVAVPPLGLEDGDSVVVDSITAGERSLFVTIAGMVRKP